MANFYSDPDCPTVSQSMIDVFIDKNLPSYGKENIKIELTRWMIREYEKGECLFGMEYVISRKAEIPKVASEVTERIYNLIEEYLE